MKNKLLLACIGLGIAAAYLGVKYRVPWVGGLLLGSLGVYALTAGARMMLTRRAVIPTGSGLSAHSEYHSGATALIWGVLFLVFGGLGIALGAIVWFVPQNDSRLIPVITSSPLLSGMVVSAAGFAIGLYGTARLVAKRETFRETKLPRIEQYFQGVLFTTMGLAILAAGIVRMIAPGALTALRDQLYDWVGKLLLR